MSRASSQQTADPHPVAVAVVQHEGRYLIGRREKHVPQGGYWEFPGGKIEPGESPSEAARRECLEEAGLEVEVISTLAEVIHYYSEADHGGGADTGLHIHFLACQLQDAAALPRGSFRWVATGELASYRFPAANDEIIRRITSECGT